MHWQLKAPSVICLSIHLIRLIISFIQCFNSSLSSHCHIFLNNLASIPQQSTFSTTEQTKDTENKK